MYLETEDVKDSINGRINYSSFQFEYEQYCTNASRAGEQPMSYASWLSRYKYVCPDDIRMLVRKKQSAQHK